MWGCSNTLGIGGMTPGGLLLILLAVLAAAGLVLVISRRTRRAKPDSHSRDRTDSADILDLRYASGEISRNDYLKMKGSLEPSQRENA